ncbi:MAG: DUF4363 family protein [Clostridiales bacterium]|nr:DUF4363 family protein [Clostridiales bacterium]
MRTFVAVIIALIIFLGLAWWNTKYLLNTSKELAQEAENIRKSLVDESWDQVNAQVMQFRRLWGRRKKTWLLLVDHDDIDEIDRIIFKIDEMVKLKEKEQALSDIAELRFLFHDIADKEILDLANIL